MNVKEFSQSRDTYTKDKSIMQTVDLGSLLDEGNICRDYDIFDGICTYCGQTLYRPALNSPSIFDLIDGLAANYNYRRHIRNKECCYIPK